MPGHDSLANSYKDNHRILDPGDAGTILVAAKDLGYVPLVTTAAGGETRTLADPLKAGIRLTLEFKTDGGDCVVTASSGVDQGANTVMTFTDIGEWITFESIELGSSFVWRVKAFDGVTGVTVLSTAASSYADNIPVTFGTTSDFTFAFDATNMEILPAVDDTGAVHIGDGTTDCAFKWWSDAAFVDFNHGTKIVEFDGIDLKVGDNDSINFGDKAGNGDFTMKFNATNLEILPDVNDTGAVHIGNATLDCDFKWFAGAGDYVEFNLGDVAVNFVDVDIQLDDDSAVWVGAGKDLSLTTDGTDGSIDNDASGSVLIGAANAVNVKLGNSGTGIFTKGRHISFQGAPETSIDSVTLTDAQIIGGILVATPTAAATYTMRTGTQIETALEVVTGPLANNDTFDLTIINLGGAGDIITMAVAAGVTFVGSLTIDDAGADVNSSGTFKFRRTAANTFVGYRMN